MTDGLQPTGTVSFLFTDVEGSTRKWEHGQGAMARDLEKHDGLLRRVIESRSGYVFTTAGDAFCAAFATPSDAIQAAIDCQRELARVPWESPDGIKVRMAVHTGDAEVREGDYFGPPLNRVARILSLAHGGQILVSTTARLLLGKAFELVDLGTYPLKDLTAPEQIFQPVIEGLESSFPPLRSSVAALHNLPEATSTFVGRAQELAALRDHIAYERVTSIVGPAGVGKTRLALELARSLIGEMAGGVWLVSLGPLDADGPIESEILEQLRLSTPSDQFPREVLLRHLAGMEAVIILDNCEHLMGHVAGLAAEIIKRSAGIRLVVTSRMPMHISGELIWELPPLDTSGEDSEATRLFLERTGKHSDTDTAVALRICRQLDGLPLAIELAAARLRSMSLLELERALADRFRLLTKGPRDSVSHHQTLEAAIDWSYRLLSPPARRTYRLLSTVTGSFTRDLAEHVVDAWEVGDAWDLIDELVDHSMLRIERGDETRYRMLESIRAHAGAQLADHPGEEDDSYRTILEWAAGFVREAQRGMRGTDQIAWMQGTVNRMDIIRTALRWSLVNDPARGLTLTIGLAPFWWSRGLVSDETGIRSTPAVTEGADWSLRMLEAAGDAVGSKLRALAGLALSGNLLMRLGHHDQASELLRSARQAFSDLGERVQEGLATYFLALNEFDRSSDEEVFDMCMAAKRLLERTPHEHLPRIALGPLVLYLGRSQEADEFHSTEMPSDASPNIRAHVLENRIDFAAVKGERVDPGDVAEAWRIFNSTEQSCMTHFIQSIGLWQAQIGQWEDAATALGISERLQREFGFKVAPYEDRSRLIPPYLSEVDEDSFAGARAAGRALSPAAGLAYIDGMLGATGTGKSQEP